jgi:hypothetical protein
VALGGTQKIKIQPKIVSLFFMAPQAIKNNITFGGLFLSKIDQLSVIEGDWDYRKFWVG